jgi:hypothetical protein
VKRERAKRIALHGGGNSNAPRELLAAPANAPYDFASHEELCTKTQMWEASLIEDPPWRTPIPHGVTTCCTVGTVIAARDRSHSLFWCKASHENHLM